MSPNLTERYATAVTNRVLTRKDIPNKFIFSTIFMVLCSALGLLMQCWSFWNTKPREPAPELLHARLVEECADPKRKRRVIKRAAREFVRVSKESLTHAESLILAEATIEEALATDPNELQTYALACGSLSVSDQNYFLAQEQCNVDEE